MKLNFELFNPKGFISEQQTDLIITVVALLLIAVIPALVLTFTFAWKYRASKQSKFTPNVSGNTKLQLGWLGFLILIIISVGTLAFKNSHALDPRKPIQSEKQAITIQVVALEWKWLFIYPNSSIASVNFLQFPEDTPINLEITADAPMNSFLIPQLGGQMYAMNGMKTSLHIMANEVGDYRGFSSNISGEGFSGMKFTARASSDRDFNAWVETARISSGSLNYNELAKPSKNNLPTTYLVAQTDLFDSIVMKYGEPIHVR
ncbi:MAG: hypothetical protein A3I07_02330 [Candidatus Doudnabacteria bacterium RIFCSPLOWO2_02_FULL_42_9]|uniref:Ubiquinol oxidase subunit 2 n=1 Tax=Candidatus Doudnabacteria bacterium RIFCSPHIGHO2_01_FULL_41_86 TaxID=1817821 RepID=A0A1F5N8M4_9BACT|nr:MAG: hypothetical protein A2717_04125 [Candidatus Doudnabacteria bacterium RIFCSPHIGHO2_01_FULL_41_86]OGE75293.1 MAG: hypothetical protein A3K07_00660 [Candidatus Doudnabacteria bacterium RIFCSPHIGHO2_01_43_10]OGE85819.1 MAG: hypothetical protein A3E28_03470 [Candidatus Doudnabacteria bacterium RIFCSPHIGHO2_12_FULL_42_22]OGE87313.1 MAG: hypothetical protein A3C49_01090 [Candidatus Doudnabacteria bacterium RIFCSPHIGHO2_02_FULL_42_25]OGE92151.1 MAG: hypothetical protein A2895_00965 [Candidatus